MKNNKSAQLLAALALAASLAVASNGVANASNLFHMTEVSSNGLTEKPATKEIAEAKCGKGTCGKTKPATAKCSKEKAKCAKAKCSKEKAAKAHCAKSKTGKAHCAKAKCAKAKCAKTKAN